MKSSTVEHSPLVEVVNDVLSWNGVTQLHDFQLAERCFQQDQGCHEQVAQNSLDRSHRHQNQSQSQYHSNLEV